MFPKIKNGGLYVVEDLHTSYWRNYGGGCRKKGTPVEYFKNFVEALNSDYIYPFNSFNSSLRVLRVLGKYFNRDFKNKVKQFLKKKLIKNISVDKKYFNGLDYPKTIESITFYDGICAIKKFRSLKNNPFKSVITGKENIGGVNCFRNEEEFVYGVKKMFR
jgi:hypothetical protein